MRWRLIFDDGVQVPEFPETIKIISKRDYEYIVECKRDDFPDEWYEIAYFDTEVD